MEETQTVQKSISTIVDAVMSSDISMQNLTFSLMIGFGWFLYLFTFICLLKLWLKMFRVSCCVACVSRLRRYFKN